MESRLIHKASEHYKYNISWLNATSENGGWFFIDTGECVNTELVLRSINEHFTDSTYLNVAFTRNDSPSVPKEDILNAIQRILGFESFFIWDEGFTRVAAFDHNGVMRYGIRK